METLELMRLFVAGLYLVGTLLFFGGVISRREGLKRAAAWCAILGFGLHTMSLVADLAQHSFKTMPRGFYVKLLSWSFLAIFFFLWWRLKLEFLALTASPLALLLLLFSMTLRQQQAVMPEALSGLFFGLHIASLFMSLALLAMAFGSGLVFLHLDRKIKTKEKLTGFRKDLPALGVFDKPNHWAALYGFPLFTLGMLSGFIWARVTWGRVISWDPKELTSVVIWILFALLFHQRVIQGLRGRKPARLAIWLFLIAVVSLVGVNLFLPTHHSFQPQ